MSIVNVVRGEFVKALTLPGVWAGLGVGVLASVALTLLNASTVRSAIRSGDLSRVADTSTFETVFAIMPLGTVGAVIIAVMVMGSEYSAETAESGGARQILTSLRAVPTRGLLLASKVLVTVSLVVLMAVVMLPTCWLAAELVIGGTGTETVTHHNALIRALLGTLYWILMGLIALAIAALARNVLIPLAFLIVNSSLVPSPTCSPRSPRWLTTYRTWRAEISSWANPWEHPKASRRCRADSLWRYGWWGCSPWRRSFFGGRTDDQHKPTNSHGETHG